MGPGVLVRLFSLRGLLVWGRTSLPQTPVNAMRMTTSLGSSIVETGRSTKRASPEP